MDAEESAKEKTLQPMRTEIRDRVYPCRRPPVMTYPFEDDEGDQDRRNYRSSVFLSQTKPPSDHNSRRFTGREEENA